MAIKDSWVKMSDVPGDFCQVARGKPEEEREESSH